MLELTEEILAGLAEGESRIFVESVQRDLVCDDPRLADDPSLSPRLWRAFRVARELGISQDAHLVQFLQIEAYAPAFYRKPVARAWLTRPAGKPAGTCDERFDDYVREIIWRTQHPGSLKGGMTDGGSTDPDSDGRSSGIGSRIVDYWKRVAGRGGGRRGG